ncbi:MAG: hypothetical protein M0Q29_10820 [Thiopseudomonas sp.]|nr:hypothetical protein [Thiopseudomonas sp.]MCK9466364.1 hypothetical protein [Thiopseudomonas sp.]
MNTLDGMLPSTINPDSLHKREATAEPQPVTDSFAAVLQQTQQSAAQSAAAAPVEEDPQATEKAERNVVDEFMAWMQMTPAEKLRDRILKELGLTEADLEAMDPEQRTQVEALIAQKIREEQELQNNQKAAKEDNKLFGA